MPDEAGEEHSFAFASAVPASPLALPSHAHIPGTGTEPDWPPLEAAKAMAADPTTDKNWQHNQAYIYGFALLRGGFFWEAHEVWEVVWLNSAPNGLERSLLRALIQIANAELKAAMGRYQATRRLIDEAQRDLDELAGSDMLMGVSISYARAYLGAMRPAFGTQRGAPP
jgi:hypothetical protein